jgi:H+/Cl- antiporter ClcA
MVYFKNPSRVQMAQNCRINESFFFKCTRLKYTGIYLSGALCQNTQHGVEMGLLLVVVMVFAKMLATSGALSTGFIGGPIFPLLFTGAAAGTAVNLIFPGVPVALAVGCSMAALTGALLPAPFMISLVVLLVTGINSLEAVPVLLAGVLSHAIVAGFGLIKPPPAKPAPQKVAETPETREA